MDLVAAAAELEARVQLDYLSPRMPQLGVPIEACKVDVDYVPRRLGWTVLVRTRFAGKIFYSAPDADSLPLFDELPTVREVQLQVRKLLMAISDEVRLQVAEDRDW